MTTLESAMEKIRADYPYLMHEYGVEKIGIFGSVARQTDDEDSDIDVVIEFARPIGWRFVGLAEHLEALLDRKVDILTQDGIANISRKNIADNIRRSIIYVDA